MDLNEEEYVFFLKNVLTIFKKKKKNADDFFHKMSIVLRDFFILVGSVVHFYAAFCSKMNMLNIFKQLFGPRSEMLSASEFANLCKC